jgi:UDP-arabinose 4-epimerase
MKTILVTGGAGFVGSRAKALARAGYLPVTFDNLERGHEWAVKWGPLERGDLRNEADLRRVFEARRPWAVMHFAGYAYVGESVLDPIKYYDANIGGTAKLLSVCAAFLYQNIVVSSSCGCFRSKSANGPGRHHAEEALPDSAPALHRGPIPSKQALGVQCRQQLELD